MSENINKMDSESAGKQKASTKQDSYADLDLEALKILHKHTYERILWYRSEIWRVATPIWAGFGGFLLAILSTSIVMRKEGIAGLALSLSVGTVSVSALVNILFYNYIGRLYDSVDKLNNMMTNREIALSKRTGIFQTVSGFMEADHTYIQHRVFPGLDILFVLSNIIMTAAIVGIIYIIVP